jgi:hypothetical protein
VTGRIRRQVQSELPDPLSARPSDTGGNNHLRPASAGDAMRTSTHGNRKPTLIWLGVILLALGLAGHLLAAAGTGGRAVDYRHHVMGFVLLSVISGVVVAAIGWRFWRGRHDISLVIVGALQAAFGLAVYLERFSVAANW